MEKTLKLILSEIRELKEGQTILINKVENMEKKMMDEFKAIHYSLDLSHEKIENFKNVMEIKTVL